MLLFFISLERGARIARVSGTARTKLVAYMRVKRSWDGIDVIFDD